MNLAQKPAVNIVMTFLAGAVVFSLLSSCTDHSQPNVELIQDMMESPALKPQEYDAGAPNNAAMRVPPAGTQPVGFTPYRYAQDLDGAMKNRNPLAGDYSDDVLNTGLKYYTTNCAICHGDRGEGGEQLSVSQTMALKPPSLLTDKVRGWTDGHLYHVITVGQGVMGPYAAHIPQKYRWQVVNYIRTLQRDNK